jgi:hypothetical protein
MVTRVPGPPVEGEIETMVGAITVLTGLLPPPLLQPEKESRIIIASIVKIFFIA